MRIFVACAITAAVTAGALSGLGLAGNSRSAGPINCGTTVQGSGYGTQRSYVCTLRAMPALGGEPFELRLPVIDLSCDAYAASAGTNLPAMLSCDRLSLSAIKCVDGVFGSWAVDMSARRFEVDSPQQCVTRNAPPGYKLTSGYVPHIFFRNP